MPGSMDTGWFGDLVLLIAGLGSTFKGGHFCRKDWLIALTIGKGKNMI